MNRLPPYPGGCGRADRLPARRQLHLQCAGRRGIFCRRSCDAGVFAGGNPRSDGHERRRVLRAGLYPRRGRAGSRQLGADAGRLGVRGWIGGAPPARLIGRPPTAGCFAPVRCQVRLTTACRRPSRSGLRVPEGVFDRWCVKDSRNDLVLTPTVRAVIVGGQFQSPAWAAWPRLDSAPPPFASTSRWLGPSPVNGRCPHSQSWRGRKTASAPASRVVNRQYPTHSRPPRRPSRRLKSRPAALHGSVGCNTFRVECGLSCASTTKFKPP